MSPAPTSAPKRVGISTCDAVREAFLTGTPKTIERALQALVRDKGADGSARESAQQYLTETDVDLRNMLRSTIQMECTI